jgi:hypothetical protein
MELSPRWRFMYLQRMSQAVSQATVSTASSVEKLQERLRHSIDALCEDAARVELWATALSAFALPAPHYEPSERFRLTAPRERRQ